MNIIVTHHFQLCMPQNLERMMSLCSSFLFTIIKKSKKLDNDKQCSCLLSFSCSCKNTCNPQQNNDKQLHCLSSFFALVMQEKRRMMMPLLSSLQQTKEKEKEESRRRRELTFKLPLQLLLLLRSCCHHVEAPNDEQHS